VLGDRERLDDVDRVLKLAEGLAFKRSPFAEDERAVPGGARLARRLHRGHVVRGQVLRVVVQRHVDVARVAVARLFLDEAPVDPVRQASGVADEHRLARPALIGEAPEQGVEDPLAGLALVQLFRLVDQEGASRDVQELRDIALLEASEQDLAARFQLDDVVRGAVLSDELGRDRGRHASITAEDDPLRAVFQLSIRAAADQVGRRPLDCGLDEQARGGLALARSDRAADADDAHARVAPLAGELGLLAGGRERCEDAGLSHRAPAWGTRSRG
jgi:hypothetical protein